MYRLKYPTEQSDPPLSPRETLPTMYDLPSENHEENGVDQFHSFQSELLWLTFFPANYRSDRIFCASDLYLYYDVHHQNWYKRPDWFGVVGVPKLYDDQDLRLSYVIWQEGVSPHLVVELLSPSTEKEDLGELRLSTSQNGASQNGASQNGNSQNGQSKKPPSKWEVYEKILRIPYYVIFSRYTDRMMVFTLESDRYVEQDLADSKIWMPEIELGIGLWQGRYKGVNRLWLRFYDANNDWILTEAEQLELEKQFAQQRAEQSELEKQLAEQRAESLAQRLRELGIEP